MNEFDKSYFEARRNELSYAYNNMKPDWQELSDYFLPRSVRFLSRNVNKTPQKNKKIKDSAPLKAVRNFSSGMMTGATNPADSWFRVRIKNYNGYDNYSSLLWCKKVEEIFSNIFNISNFYQNLPSVYEQLGVFGLSVLSMESDNQTVLNTKLLPLGSYSYAKNYRGRVDTFCRVYMDSAKNLKELFGFENLSAPAKQAIKNKRFDEMFEIVHFVEPNSDFNPNSVWAKNKKYISVYYETLGEKNTALSISGFDSSPYVVFEASVNGEDTYPTNSCGINALPDVKQLMAMVIDEGKAIKKIVSPTYKGPAELKNKKLLDTPAAFIEENQNGRGLSPVYEVDPRVLEVDKLIENKRNSIYELFYNDLFAMILNTSDNVRTATEVNELKEEKMVLLSPLLGQIHSALKQIIQWMFNECLKKKIIPLPPFDSYNSELQIEFVSMLAQAQKSQKIAIMERFSNFVSNFSNQFDNSLKMKINGAKMIDDYANYANISPEQLNSDEDVNIIRANLENQNAKDKTLDNIKEISEIVKNVGGIEKIMR